MTMATTIEQQVALDEALVPSTKRLRIGRSNFRLPSDIKSKESTLQVVYDVLRRSPFFKAFLVTADVPEIYMHEFWATTYVHQLSIRFKMDTRKNIVDLEAFREMLHISPRVPGQSLDEPPFEEEILDFLWFFGHSAQIKTLSDVNVNKLFQPWRSFAAVINKCLTGKSSGFDSFRLSQAQILWGLYHKRNIDYAYLIWEDFVYQVEHKKQNKSNEMYYPRFTKVIIHHFMTKKPLIPRRNKVNWHYVRDDILFSTIKVVSRHQNTQQYGAILPIKLTNEDIRNTKAYKEYYACATEEATPKPKASARRKRGGFDSFTTPPTAVASPRPITTIAAAPRLTATAKGKQPARATTPKPKASARQKRGGSDSSTTPPTVVASPRPIITVAAAPRLTAAAKGKQPARATNDAEKDDDNDNDDDEEEIAKLDEQEDTKSGEGDAKETESDEESVEEETKEDEEESFDPIPRTPKDSEDDGNGEEDQGLRGRGLQVSQDIENSHVTLTLVQPDGVESIFTTASSPIAPIQTSTPIMTPSTIATITTSSGKPESASTPFEPASTPFEPATRSASRSTTGTQSRQMSASESTFAEEPVQTTYQMDEPPHPKFETVYKATTDQLDWVNPEGQQYPHNLLQPLPLIPDNRGHHVIPFAHFINNDLEYLRGGDFKRLHLQDIKDMLLLLVQGKLSNLTVEERFAFNVSLRMFTRSIVIQQRVEDLQLGVKSY
nr:hypothetical protein [Tanacetum cinerariifolium]